MSKHYAGTVAVSDLSLDIHSGEFLSLLGPSGCGKTTTLRMIAGFEQPSSGTVQLGGATVNDVRAYQRPVNMVFQNYALFPHLTVAQNVAYGLKQFRPRHSREAIRQRVAEILALVQLEHYETRRIWELSGGQQQRIALARALVNKPSVLLLDEPLAALDRKLRHEMQLELQTLQRNVGITFILVTHDQEEALSMSDRVCLMREGRIIQIGSPRELYDQPVNRYAASFVGRSNLFKGTVTTIEGPNMQLVLDNGLPLVSTNRHNESSHRIGDAVCASIRPEQVWISRRESTLPDNQALRAHGIVVNRIFLGEHTEYLVECESLGPVLILAPRQSEYAEAPLETGDSVHVTCSRESALVLKD